MAGACSNNGTCQDLGTPYDHNFTCLCLDGNAGQRCDSSGLSSAASSSATTSATVLGGAGAGIGVFLLLLFVIFLRYRRRKNLPHNFNSMLELISGLNINEKDTKLPREIKRSAVKIVGNLGKGNFGTVDKAVLDEHHALGIPGYLVACKQLLSTRNEERASLLEEAVVMAQFNSPHCVRLIGVVTVGNPVLVREKKKNKTKKKRRLSKSYTTLFFGGVHKAGSTILILPFQILLEYCEYGSLDKYLEKNEVPENWKVMIAGDCAEGKLIDVQRERCLYFASFCKI